ncbi:MAG: hypothetical protein ABI477_24335 [Chryseolinea sp.]
MAKQKGFYTFSGTIKGVTEVDSNTWGSHVRAARGTHKPATVNDAFKESSKILITSNKLTKAIKDPLDPYREGLKDGRMWNRLNSIVKKQLHENGFLDFNAIAEFQFHRRFRFGSLIHAQDEISVSTDEPMVLKIKVLSSCGLKLTSRNKADSYEQTVIVMFLDDEFYSEVFSQSTILPLTPIEQREHVTEWTIPLNMKVALIILKCDFRIGNKSAGLPSRKGMQVVRVIKRGEDGMWIKNERKFE